MLAGDNQRVSLFHNVETMYSLPHNIQYIFNSLALTVPTFETCALFQGTSIDRHFIKIPEQVTNTMSFRKSIKRQ